MMAPPPGPYSGTSTLALVARVSAFSLGLIYGKMKLKILRMFGYQYVIAGQMLISWAVLFSPAKTKSHKKAEAKGNH